MSGAELTRAERIARLNDLARRAIGIACVVVATEGVRALPKADQSRLRELVETFDAFTPANDPYGERRDLSGSGRCLVDLAACRCGADCVLEDRCV